VARDLPRAVELVLISSEKGRVVVLRGRYRTAT
jgi:hypothetical protein